MTEDAAPRPIAPRVALSPDRADARQMHQIVPAVVAQGLEVSTRHSPPRSCRLPAERTSVLESPVQTIVGAALAPRRRRPGPSQRSVRRPVRWPRRRAAPTIAGHAGRGSRSARPPPRRRRGRATERSPPTGASRTAVGTGPARQPILPIPPRGYSWLARREGDCPKPIGRGQHLATRTAPTATPRATRYSHRAIVAATDGSVG